MASKLREYPQAVNLFSTASEILGYDLLKTCIDGPFDYLTRTDVSQPAILVTSLAAVVKLQLENDRAHKICRATAGLSLGEYSSLVFSGCLSFEDGCSLFYILAVSVVKVRGMAMHEASVQFRGGMVSAMISDKSKIEDCIKAALEHCQSLGISSPVCQCSNYLSSSFRVIGGSIEAIDYIEANASKFGIRKVKKLSVSGAFHTDMMKTACEPLANALKYSPFDSTTCIVGSLFL
ncbi:malonyl-CoA-acyl carrier protein transacylase, mitochondrial-like [Octopus sinensis]|uniref:Malonyl-CoA-acyl carrier protein transacylase, mitochondrial-like n=1 Tax=Octopus sinensis TaxID=2607531 RepID=A0A7E6EHF5_9MOLL|nr:malonyl-CoA-acyl carrier protein transacylase, mitochondrial-like [Octopus sinensis]